MYINNNDKERIADQKAASDGHSTEKKWAGVAHEKAGGVAVKE